MNLSERINLAAQLGKFLTKENEFLDALIKRTHFNNQWFTTENYAGAIAAIAINFLNSDKLKNWVSNYSLPESNDPKTVGLVLAGNIPLVGFHDILSVFIAGHYCQIKPSSKDAYVLPYLLEEMVKLNAAAEPYFKLVNQLSDLDAVIATGSNNSARYFETYFGKYPNIIRKNRNGVAVIANTDSTTEFELLGNDIFSYFGLGCRNVAKIYVPEGYEFTPMLETLHKRKRIVLHAKYKNNFDYNFALFSLNRKEFLSNGCLILVEDESLQSRISVLHFEYYSDKLDLQAKLIEKQDEIQVVVSKDSVWEGPNVSFGEAQVPTLNDYADGVDTLKFLAKLY